MEKSRKKKLKDTYVVSAVLRYFKMHYAPMLGLLAISLLIQIFSPNFFTVTNFVNILRQISVYGILSLAITMILLIGGIDLSLGSTVAAGGCLVCVLYSQLALPLWLAIILTMIAGGLIGFFNGFMAAHTKLPYFVITLATQMAIRGLAYLITRGYPVIVQDQEFVNIGSGSINFYNSVGEKLEFEIPYSVIIMLVLYFIFWIILSRSKFGRHVYATGGNPDAAVHSGINVKRIRKVVYVFASMLAAVAGIILASRLYGAQPTVGVGYEGEAIAASVLGGIRFGGGYGTLGGTLIGSFILGVINNGLNMVRMDYYYQYIVKGFVILGAVYLDSIKGTVKLGSKKRPKSQPSDFDDFNNPDVIKTTVGNDSNPGDSSGDA